jgi:hypothetical protein
MPTGWVVVQIKSLTCDLHKVDSSSVSPGFVLYNGEQPFNVRGARIFNPLLVDNIWQSLTSGA